MQRTTNSRKGGVATSQPLASEIGAQILRAGGSAVDAGIAISAAISVVEPGASHLGGDAFLITHDAISKENLAFNGSGEAPHQATIESFTGEIPLRGFKSATVPGLVSTWFAVHEKYGRLPFSELLAPAIKLASDGFKAHQSFISRMQNHLKEAPDTELFRQLGIKSDLQLGDLVKQPDLAITLRKIAIEGRDYFYKGQIAKALIEATNGWFDQSDLDRHSTRLIAPLQIDYRGYKVHGQPPPSQGLILLEELALAEGFDLASLTESQRIHLMVEAKKLAFEDRNRILTDPEFDPVDIDALFAKNYLDKRRALIDPNQANNELFSPNEGSDTTYFLAVDGDGNAVSWIQSVFHGFGASWAIPGTGVIMNNRLTGFSLDPKSRNALAPGKRPAHTLNAWSITDRKGNLKYVGGTPGANIQVQTNFQLITSLIDLKLQVQEVVEAPRWQHLKDGDSSAIDEAIKGTLYLESRFGEDVIAELEAKGHEVKTLPPYGHGSSVQLLEVLDDGTFALASDPRCEGQAIGI